MSKDDCIQTSMQGPQATAEEIRPFRLRFPGAGPLAGKIAYGCALAVLCLAPVGAAALWAPYWRVPLPASDSAAAGILPDPLDLLPELPSDVSPVKEATSVALRQYSRPAQPLEPEPAAASEVPDTSSLHTSADDRETSAEVKPAPAPSAR